MTTIVFQNNAPTTDSERINQARSLMQEVAQNSDSDFHQMLFELLDFADTGLPLNKWKAAQRALSTFKRNY